MDLMNLAGMTQIERDVQFMRNVSGTLEIIYRKFCWKF